MDTEFSKAVEKEREEFDAAWGEEQNSTAEEKGAGEVPADGQAPTESGGDAAPEQDKKTAQPPAKEDRIPDQRPSDESDEVRKLREELERERQRTRSWEGRIRAANEKARQAEAELERLRREQDKRRERPVEDRPDAPETADEDAALKAFREEFPDLPRPIIALVKREIIPMVQEMIRAEVGKIEPAVKEVEVIKRHIEVDASEAHLRAITNAHPDWKQIVSSGELDRFIEAQPSFVRRALEQVRDEGSTEEVIEMFGQYKQWASVNRQPTQNTDRRPKHDDIKDEIAVPASPGGPRVPKKLDKDNFDAAWEEAEREG